MSKLGNIVSFGTILVMTQGAAAQESHTTLEDTGKEFLIEVGPVDLPAPMPMEMAGHEHEAVFPPLGTVTVPTAGYLYGFYYEVVDAEGNQLPRNIVHHVNVIDPDHRELFLPISRRVMAAGGDTGSQAMPWMLFGYPVTAGQQLVVTVMLHNPTGQQHDDVSLRIHLKYVKVGRPWPFFEVYPYHFDVAFPAGDKDFDLPPGESSQSYEASPAVAGRLMVMGSHLHELATKIVFEDVTAETVLWEGFPITEDSNWDGVTIGRMYRRFGTKIFPDHTYRVTVHYDNTTGENIPDGGMGVVGGVFMPAMGEQWPAADPNDPLYVLDRSHYMREVRGKYDVIKDGGGRIVGTEEMDHQHETRDERNRQ